MDDPRLLPSGDQPYKHTYRVGDGATRLTEPWERPRTAEGKEQPTFAEEMNELGEKITAFGVVLEAALKPFTDTLVVATEKLAEFLDQDTEQEQARRRSRADLDAKRKLMRRTKGRR